MKRILIALTALGMFAGAFLHANNNNPAPSMLDILTAPNRWTSNNPTGEVYSYMTFTGHEFASKKVFGTEVYGGTVLFYLSDTEDTVFDSAKVGKVGNGKYIVAFLNSEPPIVLEIKEFRNNNTEMVLFFDSKGKDVPSVVYSTWYAQFE